MKRMSKRVSVQQAKGRKEHTVEVQKRTAAAWKLVVGEATARKWGSLPEVSANYRSSRMEVIDSSSVEVAVAA